MTPRRYRPLYPFLFLYAQQQYKILPPNPTIFPPPPPPPQNNMTPLILRLRDTYEGGNILLLGWGQTGLGAGVGNVG